MLLKMVLLVFLVSTHYIFTHSTIFMHLLFSFTADLIINMDETGVRIVPAKETTMAKRGSRQVQVIGLDDKRQITAVMACSMSGDLLPLQVVYGGKTDKCHPRFDFPDDFHITHSVNHWSNQTTTEQWIENILVPYLDRKREELELAPEHPALCILDLFAAHRVEPIVAAFARHHIKVVFVPGGCTGELQPLDLSCNDPFKEILSQHFSDWYASRITSAPDDNTPIKVDMRLTAIKPTHAEWLVSSWRTLRENKAAIIRGWHQAGIISATSAAPNSEEEENVIDIII